MVSARDMDGTALLPERRRGDVSTVTQLVRHGGQYLWSPLGPLHAAVTTRKELSRQCGGGNCGNDDSSRVLGLGSASLRVWKRGFHVQRTAGTARGSKRYYGLARRPRHSRRMGSVGDSKSLQRTGCERERSRRSIRVGR